MNEIYEKSRIDYGCIVDRSATPAGKRSSEENRAVILCAGDLMCEPAMSEACYFDGDYQFHTCFKCVAPLLKECDFAIANLETMVTDKVPYAREQHTVRHGNHLRYHCNAPVQYLDALRYAGFDAFALANNHNADAGFDGLIDTLDNIDVRGFLRTGIFRNEQEPRCLVTDVNGIRLGVLSYTEHINDNLDREIFTRTGQEILLNRFSAEKLARDIRQARDLGAEFLLCYLHFQGKEYSHEVLERQRKTAQLAAEAGVDCIMGSHTHSVQEYDVLETRDGRRVSVVYSLGNFISSDCTSLVARMSILYRLELYKENGAVRIVKESCIPCRVVETYRRCGYIVMPTQKKYRLTTAPAPVFDDAQEEIARAVGSKLDMEGEETSVPVCEDQKVPQDIHKWKKWRSAVLLLKRKIFGRYS